MEASKLTACMLLRADTIKPKKSVMSRFASGKMNWINFTMSAITRRQANWKIQACCQTLIQR